jgi:hypothetical protein
MSQCLLSPSKCFLQMQVDLELLPPTIVQSFCSTSFSKQSAFTLAVGAFGPFIFIRNSAIVHRLRCDFTVLYSSTALSLIYTHFIIHCCMHITIPSLHRSHSSLTGSHTLPVLHMSTVFKSHFKSSQVSHELPVAVSNRELSSMSLKHSETLLGSSQSHIVTDGQSVSKS